MSRLGTFLLVDPPAPIPGRRIEVVILPAIAEENTTVSPADRPLTHREREAREAQARQVSQARQARRAKEWRR
jgi:hypothetical protein